MREEHLIGAEAVRGERRQIDPCELGEAADRHHVPDRLAGRDRPPLVEAGIVAHEQDAQVRDGGQLRPARVDGGTIAFIDDVENLEIAHARRAVAGERGDGGDLLRDRPAFRRQAERGEEVRSLRHAGAFAACSARAARSTLARTVSRLSVAAPRISIENQPA